MNPFSKHIPGGATFVALKAAAIVGAAAFAFSPAIHGSWLWDDPAEIAENPILRDPAGLWKIWSGRAGQDFFPLTTSVRWVQWHLWGDQVAGYHLTNLALHVLSALLLWRLLLKLGAGPAAWLGGLLFAVHPLTVESVAWISELKNVLSLPLLLLAMLAFVAYDEKKVGLGGPARPFVIDNQTVENRNQKPAERAAGRDRPALPPYLLSVLLFLLSMLAKPSGVMLPGVFLLYAWWRRGRVGTRDLLAVAPFFAISLVLGLVTIHFQTTRAMGNLPMPADTFATRVAMAAAAPLFYLYKVVLPVNLLPIYPRWLAPGLVPWALAGWAAIVAGLAWCWTRRATWGRHALFGFGSFLLCLAPVLGIIPMAYLQISRVADHLAYLPLVSLVSLAAAGLSKWHGRPAHVIKENTGGMPVLPSAFTFVVAALLALSSRHYAANFKSEESLWTYTLQRNPDAWLAQNNLGIVLAKSGRFDEAILHGEQAVRLEPNLAGAHFNLGHALLAAGRVSDAVVQFEETLRLQPDNPEAPKALAVAHNNLANAFARTGRFAEAVGEFGKALSFDPGNAGIHRNLGHALQSTGQLREAATQFGEADRLERK